MNKDTEYLSSPLPSSDESPASGPPPKKTVPWGSYAATAVMFVIVIFLWRDQSRMKNELMTLTDRNELLRQDLKTRQSELNTAHDKLQSARTEMETFVSDQLTSAAMKQATKETKAAPVIEHPTEEAETLFLQPPTVSLATNGLVTRFEFKPDPNTELPDQITMVIRVPNNSAARILKLSSVAESEESAVEYKINAKGTLGVIEGAPSALKALAFELTVSAPAKATVRGSAGMKDFELNITPSGCTTRKL